MNHKVIDEENELIVLEEVLSTADGLPVVLRDVTYSPQYDEVVIDSVWVGELYELEVKPQDWQMEHFVRDVEKEVFRLCATEVQYLLDGCPKESDRYC